MTDDIRFCETPLLRMAYRDGGPADGPPVLLLHGWPDDATTWDRVAPVLQARGWRTLVPWLRGFGPTRFLDPATPRSGELVALAQDALDLADALGIGRFAVVGHDWGARAAAVLASTRPDRGRLPHRLLVVVREQPRRQRHRAAGVLRLGRGLHQRADVEHHA